MARSTHSTDETARRSLLAMLSADGQTVAQLCAGLDEADWARIQHMAGQHRLGPLLHETGKRLGSGSAIPLSLSADWAAAYGESVLRSLGAQATLIRLNSILSDAGLPYAALKGARLAWHAYPHPALRPMRDLDVLVPPARVLDAWHALRARGFLPLEASTTPLDVALRDHKHLPALADPASDIHVEVHSRLLEHTDAAQAATTLGNADALLANLDWLVLGETRIAFLPPEETLLHLIVHAAVEHRFENGPQVLHDIAALLASGAIDWPRFWALAQEGGWQRSCALLLQLTVHLLGPQPVGWVNSQELELPGQVLDAALLLMLQDTDMRQDLAVQLRLGGSLGQAKGLLGRIIPARHHVAAHARIAPDSRRVWLHYPAWLLSRIRRTLQGAANRGQRVEAARAIVVDRWLTGD